MRVPSLGELCGFPLVNERSRNRQRYRAIACGKRTAEGMILVSIYAPASIAIAAPGYFAALLASIR